MLIIFCFYGTPWKFNPFEIFAFEISFKSFKRKFVLKRKGLTPGGIRKFKISFEKIANLLSKFYCKSIVLTKSYPTSGRCSYFAFWEACKKYCAKNRRKLSKKHTTFYTLPKMWNMDIDHSLDSSSWVQSLCNKILITNS